MLRGQEEEGPGKASGAARCDYCGRQNAKMLRCIKCKSTFYCEKKCQKRDWKLHKHFCSDDPAMRPFIQVEHAVEREIWFRQQRQVDPPPDVHCFICLEGGDGLLSQGCGCRGTSGFAHPDCLEKMAASSDDRNDVIVRRHTLCATCGKPFTGVLAIVMRRKFWRSGRLSKNRETRRVAASLLGIVLQPSSDCEARNYLEAEALRGLKETDPRRIERFLRTFSDSGEAERALEILQETYPKVRLQGDECTLTLTSLTMAHVLLELSRPEEAIPFAAEAVETAEAAGLPVFRNCKEIYAIALQRSGRLREAKVIFQDSLEYFERAYGPNHERTKTTKAEMDRL